MKIDFARRRRVMERSQLLGHCICDVRRPCPCDVFRDDGWWFIQIMLPHGHHQYRFLVDGMPVLDPRAMGTGRNQLNEEVSVVAVG